MVRQLYSPFPYFPVGPFPPFGYYNPYFYSSYYPYGGYQYQQQPSTIVIGNSSFPPISVPLHAH